MKKLMFAICIVAAVIALLWSLWLSGETWNQLLTQKQKFELYHGPLILTIVAAWFYTISEMFD